MNMSTKNTKNDSQNKWQKVEQAKGRPLLQWVGKQPLESVQYYPAQEKEVYGDKKATDFNKLFWGDNLQVLSHLLKEYRGKVDLIYIDPPFDSAADYVRKVKVRGEEMFGQQQNVLEEMQYSDIWERDEYLQFLYERLLLLRELLADDGSFYLHCDWHKGAYIKVMLDEVFGNENFVNEIIREKSNPKNYTKNAFGNVHDTIYFYVKNKSNQKWNKPFRERLEENLETDFPNVEEGTGRRYKTRPLHAPGKRSGTTGGKWKGMLPPSGKHWQYKPETLDLYDAENRIEWSSTGNPRLKVYADESEGVFMQDIWLGMKDAPRNGYPTEKNVELMKTIIEASSDEGDTVLDCFCGSGTTLAVAQELGRKWIGCDINVGAIQTSTKWLGTILEKQIKEKDADFKGSLGFKVLNVNEYDVFKNELEAKEIVMEMYGVEPIKRSYFDGVLDTDFVKIISLNRVLNKMDIRSILKGIEDAIDQFTKKTTSKHGEAVYRENVVIICSGMELDAHDYLKKENKTGVDVRVYDILNDTKELIFKQYPESKMKVSTNGKKLTVEIQEFYSPLLMRRLEMENEKMLKKERQAKVKDFKQTIDSVAIDVDYDGKLFNAEVMDLPDKKEVIAGKYEWEYTKKGKNTVAVKIIDVLGEEYFETFEVDVK